MKFKKILATLGMTLLAMNLVNYTSAKDSIDQRIDQRIDKILSKMSIEEKIGQMLCVSLQGTEVNDQIVETLKIYNPGGILFYDQNCVSEDQIKKFTRDLQKNSKIPLFIAIDEEGGSYSRAREIIDPPPSQTEIGKSNDSQLAKNWAIKTATQLKNLGINLNFAPVVDVGYNEFDERCYSDDPQIVTEFMKAAVDGYRSENFLCTLKHFPGIGRGLFGSYSEFADIDATVDELKSVDLIPFHAAISNYPIDSFFMSPMVYPKIDSENSANMSKTIIQDLLRNELNYDGIVITGDFEMGAATTETSLRESGVKAVQAGVDMIFVSRRYAYEQKIYEGILDAIHNGKISENRINESVRRILRAKINSKFFD